MGNFGGARNLRFRFPHGQANLFARDAGGIGTGNLCRCGYGVSAICAGLLLTEEIQPAPHYPTSTRGLTAFGSRFLLIAIAARTRLGT